MKWKGSYGFMYEMMREKAKNVVCLMVTILWVVLVAGCGGNSSATTEYGNKFTQDTGREIYYTSRITKEEVEKYSNFSLRGSMKPASKVYMDKKDGIYEIKFVGKKQELMVASEADLKTNYVKLAEMDSKEIFNGAKIAIQFCESDLKTYFSVEAGGVSPTVAVAPVVAQSKPENGIAMDAETRKQLNTFFSNFSEAGVQPFFSREIPEVTLIDFGVRHNMMNRTQAIQNGRLSSQEVDNACQKYFGTTPLNHHSTGSFQYANGYYTIPKASGEVIRFSQIISLTDRGDGNYTANVNVFTASSGFTGNPHGTLEEWKASGEVPKIAMQMTATIKKVSDGGSRYVLVDYQKQ